MKAYINSYIMVKQLKLNSLMLLGSEHKGDSCEGTKKHLPSRSKSDIVTVVVICSPSSQWLLYFLVYRLHFFYQLLPIVLSLKFRIHIIAFHGISYISGSLASICCQNRGPKTSLQNQHIPFTWSNPSWKLCIQHTERPLTQDVMARMDTACQRSNTSAATQP